MRRCSKCENPAVSLGEELSFDRESLKIRFEKKPSNALCLAHLNKALAEEEIKALKVKHFPEVEPEFIMLISRAGGWWAEISLDVGPWRNRWVRCALKVRAGSDGYRGAKDCLYKTPDLALESLKRQLREMRELLERVAP